MFKDSIKTGAYNRAKELIGYIPATLEAKLDALITAVGLIDDFVDTEVNAIKTQTDKIPAEVIKTAAIQVQTDKIPAEVVKTAAIQVQTDKIPATIVKVDNLVANLVRTTTKKTAASIVTQNLFTVAGGAVKIWGIVGHITTGVQASANATKLVFTSTGGAAVDLCATLDVTGSAIRKLLTITGIKANALALSADEGVVVDAVATKPIIVTPGVLSMNCAANTSGVVDWYIEYEPLAPGATIV